MSKLFLTQTEQFLDFLKNYKSEKEKQGFIPTIDLLMEDLAIVIKKEKKNYE